VLPAVPAARAPAALLVHAGQLSDVLAELASSLGVPTDVAADILLQVGHNSSTAAAQHSCASALPLYLFAAVRLALERCRAAVVSLVVHVHVSDASQPAFSVAGSKMMMLC
jgi:hypothetical protein